MRRPYEYEFCHSAGKNERIQNIRELSESQDAYQIRAIRLQGCDLNPAIAAQLAPYFGAFSNLRTLELAMNLQLGVGFVKLTNQCPNLEVLDLKCTGLEKADMKAIINGLCNLPRLKKLSISANTGLDYESQYSIIEALPNLQDIDIAFCKSAHPSQLQTLLQRRPALLTVYSGTFAHTPLQLSADGKMNKVGIEFFAHMAEKFLASDSCTPTPTKILNFLYLRSQYFLDHYLTVSKNALHQNFPLLEQDRLKDLVLKIEQKSSFSAFLSGNAACRNSLHTTSENAIHKVLENLDLNKLLGQYMLGHVVPYERHRATFAWPYHNKCAIVGLCVIGAYFIGKNLLPTENLIAL